MTIHTPKDNTTRRHGKVYFSNKYSSSRRFLEDAFVLNLKENSVSSPMHMPLLIRENKDKEEAVESDNLSNMDKDLMKYAEFKYLEIIVNGKILEPNKLFFLAIKWGQSRTGRCSNK